MMICVSNWTEKDGYREKEIIVCGCKVTIQRPMLSPADTKTAEDRIKAGIVRITEGAKA